MPIDVNNAIENGLGAEKEHPNGIEGNGLDFPVQLYNFRTDLIVENSLTNAKVLVVFTAKLVPFNIIWMTPE